MLMRCIKMLGRMGKAKALQDEKQGDKDAHKPAI